MTNRFRSLLRIQSQILLLLAFAMIIPFIVSIVNHEDGAMRGFMVSIFTCILLSELGLFYFSGERERVLSREKFILLTLSMVLATVFGAIPFIIADEIPGIINALFESCSGITTTGSTIIKNIDLIPSSLLLWRSMESWIGGLAVLTILTINSDLRKPLLSIYIGFTLLEIVFLLISNGVFDSVLIAMGTISTGGFSRHGDNVASFNLYTKIVIMVFMFLTAGSYTIYRKSIRKDFSLGMRFFFKDDESRFFFFTIIIASALVAIINAITLGINSDETLILDSIFQVISCVTTTGFSAVSMSNWMSGTLMIMIFLCIMGGCSSSISSGLSCKRIIIGFKLIRRGLARRLHPNRIAKITYNRIELPTDNIIANNNYLLTYLMVIFVGIIVLSLDNMSFDSAFTNVISCLSNIGPALNNVCGNPHFINHSMLSKIVCMLLMLMGRIGLFTVLTLFSPKYWNPNR